MAKGNRFFFPLRVPKSAEVVDRGLQRLYFFLWVVTLGTLIFKFVWTVEWAIYYDISRYVEVEMRIVNWGDSDLLAAEGSRQSQGVCLQPTRFDHISPTVSSPPVVGHQCIPLCTPGVIRAGSAGGCITGEDLTKFVGADSAFLLTQMTVEHDNSTGFIQENFIVPHVQALGLELTLSYRVPVRDLDEHPDLFFSEEDLQGHSAAPGGTTSIKTVVLKGDGAEMWKELQDGETLSFSFEELINLVGDQEALDEPQVSQGPNYLPGAFYPQGPTSRVIGFNIEVNVECRNYEWSEVSALITRDHDGPICTVNFNRLPVDPRELQETNIFPNGDRLRRVFRGIFLSTFARGRLRFYSTANVLQAMVNALVLIRIPMQVVLFLALNGLGLLSVIYKKVICQRVSVEESLGGACMRLMMAASVYQNLSRISRHGMNEEQIKTYVGAALGNRLGEQDLNHLVTVCKDFVMPKKADGMVSLREFTTASASNEDVEPENLLALFDGDRELGRLEHYFLPVAIKHHEGGKGKTSRELALVNVDEAHGSGNANVSPTSAKSESSKEIDRSHMAAFLKAELDNRVAHLRDEMSTLYIRKLREVNGEVHQSPSAIIIPPPVEVAKLDTSGEAVFVARASLNEAAGRAALRSWESQDEPRASDAVDDTPREDVGALQARVAFLEGAVVEGQEGLLKLSSAYEEQKIALQRFTRVVEEAQAALLHGPSETADKLAGDGDTHSVGSSLFSMGLRLDSLERRVTELGTTTNSIPVLELQSRMSVIESAIEEALAQAQEEANLAQEGRRFPEASDISEFNTIRDSSDDELVIPEEAPEDSDADCSPHEGNSPVPSPIRSDRAPLEHLFPGREPAMENRGSPARSPPRSRGIAPSGAGAYGVSRQRLGMYSQIVGGTQFSHDHPHAMDIDYDDGEGTFRDGTGDAEYQHRQGPGRSPPLSPGTPRCNFQ
mmetsp:Transcript_33758/g.73889  ORF Transcript_33758/g.73889 Transcript_33758/m.73889 type:complete len:952 (+) Transcript_33758:79-2934(+)